MKKIVVLAILIAVVSSVSAQKQRGFGGQIEVGYGFKAGSEHANSFQIYAMPGYHISSELIAGIGVGYNSLSAGGVSVGIVPIFAHANYTFDLKGAIKPFMGLKLGYGIYSETVTVSGATAKSTGGVYISPAIGVKYSMNEKGALLLSLGYDAQALNTEASGGGQTISASGSNKAIVIRLGYEF